MHVASPLFGLSVGHIFCTEKEQEHCLYCLYLQILYSNVGELLILQFWASFQLQQSLSLVSTKTIMLKHNDVKQIFPTELQIFTDSLGDL